MEFIAKKDIKIILARMDDNIRSEFARIIASLEGCRLYEEHDTGQADLLIMQLGEDAETEFPLVHQAIRSGVAEKVCLTSRFIRPEVLIEAMRAGVKEFFPQPLQDREVRAALIKLRDEKTGRGGGGEARPDKKGRIVSVVGSKGGIGTTTVAVNLAASLEEANPGKSVALIDMNLNFGEVPLFLGLKESYDWAEVAKNLHRLDYTYLMSVMSHKESGLHVLSAPVYSRDESLVSPDVMTRLLQDLKSMFDYVVIDTGQTMDFYSRAVFKISDLILLVAIQTLPCLVNARRILETFDRMGHPGGERIMIVLNRYLKRSVISDEDAAKTLKKPIFQVIPNDFQNTMGAINQGTPLVKYGPKAEVTDHFREMARKISGAETKKKKGFLRMF